jgi:hypothetical protein
MLAELNLTGMEFVQEEDRVSTRIGGPGRAHPQLWNMYKEPEISLLTPTQSLSQSHIVFPEILFGQDWKPSLWYSQHAFTHRGPFRARVTRASIGSSWFRTTEHCFSKYISCRTIKYT